VLVDVEVGDGDGAGLVVVEVGDGDGDGLVVVEVGDGAGAGPVVVLGALGTISTAARLNRPFEGAEVPIVTSDPAVDYVPADCVQYVSPTEASSW
jgi:hypothetical protein